MAELNVDILILVFNELIDEKHSLHSCLLVNREWCRLVVPILWKNHSWSEYRNGYKSEMLFKTIVNLLPSSSKQFLSENHITFAPLKPPLFNYIKFCEFPDSEVIRTIILTMMCLYNNDERKLLEQELYKLFVSQCKGIEYFRWDMPQPLSLYPGASTCFSQLYSLYIDLDFISSNVLHEMAPICRDLYELSIGNYSRDLPGLISLINAQRDLNCIEFFYPAKKATCKELVKALASKSNTINELYLEVRDTILPLLLTPLNNLKTMTIHNTIKHNDIIEEIKEHLAIWEFPDLQHLRIIDLSCFKEFAILIEKTKGNISQVSVHLTYKVTENTGMLIRAIANNCPKIKVFSTYLVPDEFVLIKSLLISCRTLEELCLDSLNGSVFFANNYNENIGDELLDILIKFSPSSLVDITISGSWTYSNEALERFFESCRERTLDYFNISCHGFRISEDHKAIIRKYFNEGVIKKTYDI